MTARIQIFFTPSSAPEIGNSYELSREESHHLTRVLRVSVGQEIKAVDKRTGTAFQAIIAGVNPAAATIRLVSRAEKKNSRPAAYRVLLPTLKGQRFDWVLEKVTELGVEEIIIFNAQRSVSRADDSKLPRWSRICESAAAQSSRLQIPKITFFSHLTAALAQVVNTKQPCESCLCCSLSSNAQPIRQVVGLNQSFSVVVGPEGDFTKEEETLFEASNFRLVSLGDNILRADTAAIVALSMVNALGSPP